jgi:hypothetical protein
MIAKEAQYLNEKLTQLKQSVLNKNNQILEYENKPQNLPNVLKNTEKSKNDNFPPYFSSQKRILIPQNNSSPYNPTPSYKPNYTNKLISLRNIDNKQNFNQFQSSKYIPKDEFQDTVLRNENKENLENNINLNIRASKSVNPYRLYSNMNENRVKFQRGNNIDNNEDYILDSVMKGSQMGKRQIDLKNDLNENLAEEINYNSELENQINGLARRLEEEKNRLEELNYHFREELRNVKVMEQEKIHDFENIEKQDQEIVNKYNMGEKMKTELASDKERIEYDNKMLKMELKRIGEITAEKVMDLENNINSIGRMRDFEKENFEMERDKINNSSEFVIEQMKLHFDERSKQIFNNMRNLEGDTKKLDNMIKSISNELKNFNNNADLKIQNMINFLQQDEEQKQSKELREIEDKIKIEENEINSLQQENRNLIDSFQNLERELKNNSMNKRNLNLRLKEEHSYLEQTYNKMIMNLNSENKSISQKQKKYQKLEEELQETESKQKYLEDNYKKECEELEKEQNDIVNDINDELKDLLRREKELLQEIEKKKEQFFHLEASHNEAIEEIQTKFKNLF